MATEDPGDRLKALAEQAQERSARLAAELDSRQGQPPAPGDLFVLAATADLPVEWAVLDRQASGELLAVPADTHPLAGSADVEVEEGAPGGPLVLRCRFGVWLPADLFDPEHRTGFLTADTVADALHCWRQGETGRREASPLAEEVDADPEYRDWIHDVPERARDLARAARPARRKENAPTYSRAAVAYRLAATLALVCIGLSVWVVLLRQRVDWLSQPIVNAHSGDVTLGSEVRGDSDIEVPPDAEHIQLVLLLDDPTLEPGEGRLEIVSVERNWRWRSGPVRISPEDGFSLVFRRERLPDGVYEIRLYRGADFGGVPLLKKKVRIKTASNPDLS
jgi:hypothetical protein